MWGASRKELLLEELEACFLELDEFQDRAFSWFSCECQQSYHPSSEYRVVVVAQTFHDLKTKLQKAMQGLRGESENDFTCEHVRLGAGFEEQKVALLFGGEGSQAPDMGRDLALFFPQFFDSWQKKIDSLPHEDAAEMIDLIFPKALAQNYLRREQQCAELLSKDQLAEPAIVGFGAALFDLFASLGVPIQAIGGHNIGELLALYAGGAVDEQQLMRISRNYGILKSKLRAEELGAMLAVFAPEASIKNSLEALPLNECYFACFNAPKWQIMAGNRESIKALEQELNRKGIDTELLAESAAFHSPLLASYVPDYESLLQKVGFKPLKMRVYSGRFASLYPKDPIEIPSLLASQLAQPIRFQSIIETMNLDGCNLFLELGHKQTLTKSVQETLVRKPVTTCSFAGLENESALAKFLDVVGLLISKGVKIDTGALWTGFHIPKHPEDSYIGQEAREGISSFAEDKAESLSKDYNKGALKLRSHLEQTVAKEASMSKFEESNEENAIQAADFLSAFREVQKQTAEAHEAFQKSMAEAHLAYLKSAEESFKGLASLMQKHEMPQVDDPEEVILGGSADKSGLQFQTDAEANEADLNEPMVPERQGAKQIEEVSQDQDLIGFDPEVGIEDIDMQMSEEKGLNKLKGASRADMDPLPDERNDEPKDAIKTVLFGEISKRTGYPLAMLDLSLNLDRDLGIDGAKKVEILSALSDKLIPKQGMTTERVDQLKNLYDISQLWSAIKISTQDPDPETAAASDGEKKKSPNHHYEPAVLIEPPGTSAFPEAKLEKTVGVPVEGPYRHVVMMKPVEPLGLAQPGLWWPKPDHKVFVSDSGTSLSSIFCELLKSKGIHAVLGKQVPKDARAVIFMGGLRPAKTPEEAIAINEECFAVARDAASIFGGVLGAFITIQDTGGSFGFEAHDPIRCFLSGLPGISKTLHSKQPQWSLKSIDINQGMNSYQEIAQALFNELAFGGSQGEVGLGVPHDRASLEAVPKAKSAGSPMIKNDDVIMVMVDDSGGCAKALTQMLEECRSKLVLVGRSKLLADPEWALGIVDAESLRKAVTGFALQKGKKIAPLEASRAIQQVMDARGIQRMVSSLREHGHEVTYFCYGDLDWDRAQRQIHQVRESLGPITGLINGLGLVHDSVLPNDSLDEFRRVFIDKVKSFMEVIALTQEDPLRFIFTFSLADSFFLKSGQIDHAMANEVLRKMAFKEARKRGESCLIKNIFWEELEEHFASKALKEEMSEGRSYDSQVIIGTKKRLLPSFEELSMNLYMDVKDHPFLRNHMFGGKVIIPLVMVIDWFNRLMLPLQDTFPFYKLEQLKVHKNIELENDSAKGECFVLKAQRLDQSDALLLFASQVCSLSGEVLYSAQIELSKEGLAFPKTLDLSGFNEETMDAGPSDKPNHSYGSEFQSLKAVGQVDNKGVQAKLVDQKMTDWGEGEWLTHASAYDGGLQLARLWSYHVLGGASLTTEISKIHSYIKNPQRGPIRCVLKKCQVDEGKACADMYFLDQADELFAKFEGVSTRLAEGV
ncbi:MAG: acyltransferase domain-containing protein [Oligoflexales bacterium]|nr:acyltransferase domain-containing protein [Oligoflexales bacterium]